MTLDPAILARVQFAFTVSLHIIFPTISIGLAMFLAIVEGLSTAPVVVLAGTVVLVISVNRLKAQYSDFAAYVETPAPRTQS